MITAKAITKHFDTPAGSLEVLRGIDLTINEGEMVAVVGASGVGKSTMLHILGTLDRPSSGNLTYGTTNVFDLSDNELTAFRNSTVGFVFQFHHLLPEFTALENVMMPALIKGGIGWAASREKASTLLRELGLSQRETHRPGELSGGEQQRVAVARALILSPAVVMADEPTGNLDTATGEELFEILLQLNAERHTTFVIVTHNEQLSARCGRILEMKNGRISD
jgi:lipoprotein-releasing system ATP-binding protein